MNVHDGYRDAAHNQRVGGAADSQHLYLGLNSAADFDALPNSFYEVFDWIRLQSELPFDQVILERNKAGQPRCLHISYNGALTTQLRMALEWA